MGSTVSGGFEMDSLRAPITSPTLDPPTSPARLWAEATYFVFRPHPTCGSRTKTIEQMLTILATKRDRLPPDAPPADRELLEIWEKEGAWEIRYRDQELASILEAEGLQPDRRLSALLHMEQEAREVLDGAILVAKRPVATKDDVAQYNTALNAWTNLQTKIAEAEADTRRRTFEQGNQDRWGDRYQEIFAGIMANYQGLGPQYEVLVSQLARQQVRVERAEASGRDVPLEETNESTKLTIALVGQLQKYTEATKSEAIRQEQQDAIMAVLRIVEGELSDYPNLWQRVAQRVHRLVTGAVPLPSGVGA